MTSYTSSILSQSCNTFLNQTENEIQLYLAFQFIHSEHQNSCDLVPYFQVHRKINKGCGEKFMNEYDVIQ